MAFNSDPQNFEQYVRQSVERVHRVPSDEVWEQLAERLDAYDGFQASSVPPAKTSGKLKMIAWPAISMLTAAAVWALLVMNGSSHLEQQKPAETIQSAPLVQHTTPKQPEQPAGHTSSRVQPPTANTSLIQHQQTPAANHSANKQYASTSTQVQTNADVTKIKLSFPDSNDSENVAIDRVKRIPMPNPWNKSLSFNYPNHTAPAFFAEAQQTPSLAEEAQKRRKINFNFPKLSLKSLRKGNDWDYQVGLVAASFRTPELSEVPEPRLFKQTIGELGVQAEWILSERFRLASGLRSGLFKGEFNPEAMADSMINNVFFSQSDIGMSDVKEISQLIYSEFSPQLSLQMKTILNPRGRKIRYFMGLGSFWRFWFMNHRKSVVRLKDDSISTILASSSARVVPHFGMIRLLGGIEWTFAQAVNGQISGFADLSIPTIRTFGFRHYRPLVGVEGAIYVTGNRGYFRRMR